MAFDSIQFLKEYSKSKREEIDAKEFNPKSFLETNYPNVVKSPILKTSDLDTVDGLYRLANQVGLKEKADQVLATKGEKPKEIFSGGFISDIFDVLNSLQYGVVGILKGKGFAEGVKTRQSFSDKDALGDNGIPGVIAGIALDIAVDPLTYIAPWTILKKLGIVKKLEPLTEIAKASQVGKWFGRKFVYMFGADPVFREAYEKSIKNITVSGQQITEMTKGIMDFAPETAGKLLRRDETGRFIRTGLEELEKVLSPKEFEKVSIAWNKLDDLGKQAVDFKLLGKAKFEENVGEYIKNAYLEYEQKKGTGIFGFMKLGIKGIKARKPSLTPEKMAELGQIDNPAYLLFKSMFDLTKDIENAKLFKLVNEKFGKEAIQEGFEKLPDVKRLGDLAGKFVPQNIFDYIQEISKPIEIGVGKKLVAGFKFGKVILNPATHARNILSNQVLNWWKLGMNPLDPRVIGIQGEAIQQIAKGGKWIDEARMVGYDLNTYATNEIRDILLRSPEGKTAIGGIKGLANKLADIYQGEENFAKLSAFIFNRKYKGMGIEEAWKLAESATFNYAQVTPFIRKVRESLFGFPFITFTYKATPIAIETVLKAPRRISAFGKIKNAIENASDIKETEKERASEPAWIRDGFFIKLPIKDKHGRSAYFDLTYIIPFGDLMSGQYFTRQINRATGLPESVPESLFEKAPFFNVIKELAKNQDFYGDKIWKESDTTEKQLGDIMRHLTKFYSPPLIADQLPGGYMPKNMERRTKGIIGALQPPEKIGQQRTFMEEMLRNVGMKVQPIDVDIQETFMDWEKKKALETLLLESNTLKEFRRLYVPK